jgi:hypothetical protein
MANLKYFRRKATNQSCIHEDIKTKLKKGKKGKVFPSTGLGGP